MMSKSALDSTRRSCCMLAVEKVTLKMSHISNPRSLNSSQLIIYIPNKEWEIRRYLWMVPIVVRHEIGTLSTRSV